MEPPTADSISEIQKAQLRYIQETLMRGEARWGWQHSIPPTKSLRYSITFCTRR